MVIAKGEAWGDVEGPDPTVSVHDDADLAAAVAGRRGVVVAVTGGDLHKTLGLPAHPRPDPRWFPVDLGLASIDGDPEIPFVAHAVFRRRWWLGRAAVVMNGAWIGDRYLGPRAHPNDGLLDITFGAVPPRQLLAAARRSRTGTHLPHPDLSVRRVDQWSHTFDRRRGVWLDGRRVGFGRHLRVRLEPDWFTVVG